MPPAYTSPTTASAGLTAAFSPTTPQQKAAIANAAALVPTQPPPPPTKTTEPTVVSSANVQDKIDQTTSGLANLPVKGQTIDATSGTPITLNADRSPAEAPSDAVQIQDAQGNTLWKDSSGKTYALGSGGTQLTGVAKTAYDKLTSIQANMDALGVQQVQDIKDSYAALITQQEQTNRATQGSTYALLARGGSLQTESSGGIMQTAVSYGIQQISDLNAKESAAITAAQVATQNFDYQVATKQYDIAQQAAKDRQDAIQKVMDTIQKAKDQQVTQNNAIDTQIRSAILDAQKGGATPDQISKMNDALANHDYAGALAAGGSSFTDPTSTAGQYAAYVKATQAKGLTPMLPGDFIAKQKGKEAYGTAYQTALGKAAGEEATGTGTPTPGIEPVPGATGITQAAGLSLQAFNFLTQGTSSMSRMPAAQRNQIMKEANDWLNKHGVDIATFQSQYKAYNDVLQKNIMRANQTQVMAGEVSGSADSLMAAIDQQDLGKLKDIKGAVIVDLLAGKQVNDPVAMKYASQIKFMANDLAGYMAAARGATTPELQDQRDAADIISNGLSKGSVQAFKDSVNANEEKVAGVVQKAVDSTQKQVWNLFGVGDQYKPKVQPVDAKKAVETFVSSNSSKQIGGKPASEFIADMAAQPGATPENIYAWLTKNNYITP